MIFHDRRDAARSLAAALARYHGRPDAVVLAIPRGGVVVGAELARELELPLDVVLVKKIGHPLEPEYAIGAVDLEGEVLDEEAVARDAIPDSYLAAESARLRALLREREARYHARRPPVPVEGRTVILCDDGVATGFTLLAALELTRRRGASRTVVAVPVGPPGVVAALRTAADEVVCAYEPPHFHAIGQFYADFGQVDDEEAIRLLEDPALRPRTRAR